MVLLKKIFNSRLFKILTNKYVLILIIFSIWMLFFDENSHLNHRKLNQEIEELENAIEFYQKEIEKNREMIHALKDQDELEKFAREAYQMKKENETLYLIEFDTLR